MTIHHDKKNKLTVIAPKKAPLHIHVNSHIIRDNKDGKNEPPISVRYGRGRVVHYAHKVRFEGPVTFIYGPEKPLSCGAKLWAETNYSIVCY